MPWFDSLILTEERGKEMISVANKAKEIEEYYIANTAMQFLLAAARHPDYLWGGLGQSPIKVVWETNDPEGDYPDEAYYDLVAVEWDAEYLCIPAPLLNPDDLVWIWKVSSVDARGDHKRERREAEDGEADALWAAFLKILAPLEEDILLEENSWTAAVFGGPDDELFQELIRRFKKTPQAGAGHPVESAPVDHGAR